MHLDAATSGSLKRSSALAKRHNAYVDQCLAMLFAATGHRPVRDPFPSIGLFDLRNGLLLVSDKVVSEDRAWRLVALPEVARRQVIEYLNYLPDLAARLAVSGTRQAWLPAAIQDLAGENRANLPLFFHLADDEQSWKSVSPAVLERRWQAFWPFPIGMLRHVTASELSRATGRADWVEIQLGHVSGVDHPFGASATQSALTQLKSIGETLDAILRNLGWRVRPPPLRASARDKADAERQITRHKKTLSQHASADLAHVKRAKQRERRRQAAAPVVRDLISSLIGNPSQELSEAAASEAVGQLVAKAQEHRLSVNHCFVLLHRFLRRFTNGSNVLRRIGPVRFVEAEPSPFAESSLTDFSALHEVRQFFLDYLERSGASTDPSEGEQIRLAEILLSAVIFGGLAHQKWINRLLQALPNALYQYEGRMFLDLPLTSESDEGPVYRWFPDPATSALILGWRRNKNVRCPPQDLGRPNQLIRSLLRDIGLAKAPNVPTLIRMARTALWIEQPGFVAAVLALRVSNVSLPLSSWVRTRSGARLDTDVLRDNEHRLPSLGLGGLGAVTTAKQVKQGEGAWLLAAIRASFEDAQPVDPRGNVRQNSKRKQCLAASLKSRFGVSGEWSSLALSLADWGVHLCEKGTRAKRHLAFSTVQKYLMTVAKALYGARIPSADFLSMESQVYEQMYLGVLEDQPSKRARYLFGRLREYHDFLADTRAVDEPDWSVLAASTTIPVSASFADANLLTEAEYLRALACIRDDASLPPRLSARYGLLIWLGFRFGLRFGEAHRLEVRNIQADSGYERVFLEVSSNVHGDVKTDAAIRVIPLLGQLRTSEIQLLNDVLPSVFAELKQDGLHPLMSAESGERALIDRSTAVQYLHGTLRAVTGDRGIRFHSLRHAWASRAASSLLSPYPSRQDSKSPGLAALLGPGQIRYPLRVISTAIGHARDATTIASYIHTIDEIVADHVRANAWALSDRVLSYCLRLPGASVRKRRCRHPTRCPAEVDITALLAEPTVPLESRPFVCPSNLSDSGRRTLSVGELDWLLRAFGGGGVPVTAIADRLGVDTPLIEHAIQIAADLERQSGYSRYDLTPHLDDPVMDSGARPPARVESYAAAETKRVRALASEVLKGGARDEIERESGAWVRTYRHHDSRNYPTEFHELEDLRNLFHRIDSGLTVEVLVDSAAQTKRQLIATLQRHGFLAREKTIPLASERHPSRRHGRLCITVMHCPVRVKSRTTLHRTLFLLSIMLRLDI
ncbi:site-specific integrase [Thioalkalivibrio sp. AKL12]|uniref:site-specific integrase n=1 Tax=Thioalkalivibrio sp. AKL12 TaxID=1158159 RepID=UPI0012DF502B|nr:site-specific integrase [Thioalkalivibrio sp. AKL12]